MVELCSRWGEFTMEEAILIFQFSKTFNKKKTFLINHEKHEQITTLMLYHIHYQH